MIAKFIGGPLNGKELWLDMGDPTPVAPDKVGIKIRSTHDSERISIIHKSGSQMRAINCDLNQMCDDYQPEKDTVMLGRYVRKSSKEEMEHKVCYWWDRLFEQRFTARQWKQRRQPNGRTFF